jgi:hypothetical protein
LKKNQKFVWTQECEKAFFKLKQLFTKFPVLKNPDQDKPFQIEADAYKYVAGAILTQLDSNGVKHPVAYLLKTFNNAERRYEIYDQEMLAIIWALREWRHYIQGSPFQTDIFTDHLNLQYFRRLNRLNDRQRRWIPELQQYNFKIHHLAGSKMTQAGALSRRPDHLPAEEEPVETILLPDDLFARALRMDRNFRLFDDHLEKEIANIMNFDEEALRILTLMKQGKSAQYQE